MIEKTKNNSRNEVIDTIKGIAAVLVVWGHSIQYLSVNGLEFWDSKVFQVIYSFHMPLFMVISGYLFYWTCKKDIKLVMIGRARSIGVPMLTWGTLISLVLYRSSLTPQKWLSQVIDIWFLWAVLISSVLVGSIVGEKQRKSIIKYCVMFLLGIMICVLPNHTNVMYIYPYFVFGYALNEYDLFSKLKNSALVAVGLWGLMIPFYKKRDFIYISGLLPHSLKLGEIGMMLLIDSYRWLIGGIGSVAIIGCVQLLPQRFYKTVVGSKLKVIGQYSLNIYVMQRLILEICIGKIFEKIVITTGINYLAKNVILFYVATFFFALVLVMACIKISEMIEKNRVLGKILFGRNKM